MTSQFIQPEQYQHLLDEKVSACRSLFGDLGLPSPQVFPSSPKHYRMRAEFRVWHDNDDLFYAMFDPNDPKVPLRVDDFPVASEAICKLMPVLRSELISTPVLRHRLFQIEFLSTLSGDMLVSLIYHRRLDDAWQTAATALTEQLGISIIGRSRKQKCVIGQEYVEETLPIGNSQYHYRQYEGGFTQPNAQVNCKMIEWAIANAEGYEKRDLLELYCGNGNFTAPLSRSFRKVLATEISKTSVKAARENFAHNGLDNIDILRMSSEEFTSALNGERQFRRMEGKDLADYDIGCVLVDPPRAGLDAGTRELIARFERIIYISCNPQTLRRDLEQLRGTHHTIAFALFDQFPYTDHMECGVILQRQ